MRSILVFLILGLTIGACARTLRTSAPQLSDDIEIRRAQQIQRLHDYRVAGVFPIDARGFPLSVFRDQKGKPRPMAALIEQSGGRSLVDRVVRENNTLRLADVHDGPLMDWMLDSGLTQEEVAYVQGVMNYSPTLELAPPTEQALESARQMAYQEIKHRLEEVERKLFADSPRSLPVVYARMACAKPAVVATSH